MSDHDIEMLPGKRVEISARFIRQAWEHLQATGERYVTLLFAGDFPTDSEIVCVGVSTRRFNRVVEAKLIREERAPSTPPAPTPPPRGTSPEAMSSLENQVLDAIREHGPLSVKGVGDSLNLAGDDTLVRGRVRRIVNRFFESRKIQKTDDRYFPEYIISGRSPVETAKRRGRPAKLPTAGPKRTDITHEKVMEFMRRNTEPLESKDISDGLGIPRAGALSVRSKVSIVLSELVSQGQINKVDRVNGYWSYRLNEDTNAGPRVQPVSEEPLESEAPDPDM